MKKIAFIFISSVLLNWTSGIAADINEQVVQVQKTVNSTPDFIITSVTGPSNATPGQSVSVSVTCKNQGGTSSQTGYVILRMILSPDNSINLGDNYYKDYNIPSVSSLSAGNSVSYTFTYTIPTGLSGTYYWGAYVDAGTYFTETNENNNALSGNTVSITSAPTSPTGVRVEYQSSNNRNYLTWNSVSGATSYKIYWSNTAGVSKTNTNTPDVTYSTAYGHSGVVPGYTYYYRVAAINSAGESSLSSEVSVTVPALPDFIVTSVTGPSNATPGQSVSVSVTCKNQGGTSSQTGSIILRMILSPDNSINLGDTYYQNYNIPSVSSLSSGNSVSYTFTYTIPSGLSGTYYWGAYVDAGTYFTESNENNNALSGNTVSITSAPSTPTGVHVEYQSSNNRNYLTWNSVSGATSYKIYWSNTAGVSKTNTNTPDVTYSTAYGHSGLVPGYTYYYRVAAINSAGESSLSSEVSVTVPALPDFIVTSVTGPSNVTPGQSVSVSVTCKNQGGTSSQTGSIILRMILSPDNSINLGDTYYQNYNIPSVSSLSSGNSVSYTFTYTIPSGLSGTYYWGAYVDAGTYFTESNENNNALSGNTVSITSAPSTPTGVNVEYQSSNNRNYLTWNSVSGATSYKIYWSNTSGVSQTNTNTPDVTYSTAYGHSGVVPGYTYYYRVAAVNSAGESVLSTEVSVSYISPPTQNFGKPLSDSGWYLSQDFGSCNSTWKGYHLGEDYVSYNQVELPVYAIYDGTVKHVASHSGYGYVVIIEHTLINNDKVCSVYGHLRLNDIISSGATVSKGQLIGYLSNKSTENGGYNFTHLHFGIRKDGYSEVLDPDGKWRYRGYGPDYICSLWYDGSEFIASQSISIPTLSTPSQNATHIKGSDILFSWIAVQNTSKYEIWIDNSEAFGSPEIGFNNGVSPNWLNDGIVNSTNFTLTTSMQNQLPQNVYYWKVRALNASENPISDWTSYRKLTLLDSNSEPPSPLTPINTTYIKGDDLLFTWSTVPNAIFYEIWIDNNSGFGSPEIGFNNEQSPDWINNGIVESNNFLLTSNMQNQLPQNVYFWKIRALDINYNPLSDFSSESQFILFDNQPDPPILLNPDNNTEFTKGFDISFSWSTVSNASYYEIWIDNSEVFDSPEIGFNNGVSPNWLNNGIVSTNSFIFTNNWQNHLEQDLYYWKVRALNIDEQPITDWSSELRSFILHDNTVGVQGFSDHSEFQIYPNPVSDKLTLTTNGDQCHYEILNVTGQIVKVGQIVDRETIFLDKLVSGTYVIKFKKDNGFEYVKIIKE